MATQPYVSRCSTFRRKNTTRNWRKGKKILRLPNNTRIKLSRKQTKIKRNFHVGAVEGSDEGYEVERKKNKIMLQVLNVEILWQSAIRWKGMHVGKRTEVEEKNWQTETRKRKRQKSERGRVKRFSPLPNISYSAILFTDKRTRKNCIETGYVQRRKMRRLYTRRSHNRFIAFIDFLCFHVHKSNVLNTYIHDKLQIWATSCFSQALYRIS